MKSVRLLWELQSAYHLCVSWCVGASVVDWKDKSLGMTKSWFKHVDGNQMITEGLLRFKTVHGVKLFNAIHLREMTAVAWLYSCTQPVFIVYLP